MNIINSDRFTKFGISMNMNSTTRFKIQMVVYLLNISTTFYELSKNQTGGLHVRVQSFTNHSLYHISNFVFEL